MKTLRYLTSLLFLSTAVIHLFLAIKDTADPNFFLLLLFGIVYLACSVLVFMNLWFALWVGFFTTVLPIVFIAPFMIDFQNLDWRISMPVIELAAGVLCLVLLIKRKKP